MNKTIDTEHIYVFPSDIRYIKHKGKNIVILPETSNWIVLDNSIQIEIFRSLCSKTIQNVLDDYAQYKSDCITVITQIEARHLESASVTRNNNTNYSMHLYLTNECNLSCPHCYMSAGRKLHNELSTTEVITLLNDFKQVGGTGVILSGGEIGLRKDLIEIIDAGYSIGLKVDILSNGTLLSSNLIQHVANKLNRAQISIDGYSEESNSVIRGKGNFDRALSTIDNLIKYNVATEVAITPFPTDDLKTSEKKYIEFGRHLKEKYGDKLVVKITTDLMDGRYVKLTNEEKNAYTQITERIAKSIDGTDGEKSGFIKSARLRVVNDNCSYGAINVASNGDVYPCARIGQCSPFGNIRKQSMKELIEKSDFFQNKSNVNNLIPCRDCELKYICGGGCRIDFFKDFYTIIQSNTAIMPSRICSKEYKDSMLDLLIETNEYIFT